MDGADEGAAALGAWASIRRYFTPATLFLVVNLVIGTIALTSRSHQRRRRRQGYHHHGGEEASHLEPFHQVQTQQQEYHQHYSQQQEQLFVPPAPLARTSSVLDRLRSFGLYRFRSGDFPPEYTTAAVPSHTEDVISPVEDMKQQQYARSRSEPAPAPAPGQEKKKTASRLKNSSSEVRRAEVVSAPARVVEAFAEETAVHGSEDEFIDNFTPDQQEEHAPRPAPEPAPLARTSSVLDRLRSFGLYRFRSGDVATEEIAAGASAAQHDATAAGSDEEKMQAAHYGRSRSEPAREQNKKAKQQAASEAKKMAKSSSEARKEAAAPIMAEEAVDDGVDARADDFINKFRQQLQLQRLNSLLNYREMLSRSGKQ